MKNQFLLQVQDMKKYFPKRRGTFARGRGQVKAVDGVTFEVRQGETLGLVGESGCGKTTTARCILRLIEPTAGHITLNGVDLLKLDKQALRRTRRDMQIIFQDPLASLNPRMSVGKIAGEPLVIHDRIKGQRLETEVQRLLELVGLDPGVALRYPHELSGGQRQRIAIARAIALRPQFIVADEPVSALDVSVRAQILNLLRDLQQEFGLAFLLISHDLSIVEYMCDRVAVMYLGKIVEVAGRAELYANPLHPYTKALISAIPMPNPFVKKERVVLAGDIPSPLNPPSGCPFHPRCPIAQDNCQQIIPPLEEKAEGHATACLYV